MERQTQRWSKKRKKGKKKPIFRNLDPNFSIHSNGRKTRTRHVTRSQAWKRYVAGIRRSLGRKERRSLSIRSRSLDRKDWRRSMVVLGWFARAPPATEEHGRVYERGLNRGTHASLLSRTMQKRRAHQRPPPAPERVCSPYVEEGEGTRR